MYLYSESSKKVTIMKINTRERVLDVKFSTGSNFFAVVRQGRVDVWALQLVGLDFEKLVYTKLCSSSLIIIAV